jgi:hypothetical protein
MAGRRAKGATLFVARLGRSGRLLPAAPCDRCGPKLARAGVQKITTT